MLWSKSAPMSRHPIPALPVPMPGMRRKERPRTAAEMPSREEAANTVPYLFHVFRKTRAWCVDKMGTVRNLRTRLLEMQECRARNPSHAELLLVLCLTVTDGFESVIVPNFLAISQTVQGIEESMGFAVDEEDEAEMDVREDMIPTSDGIEGECCVLSDEYVSLLPLSAHSSARYLVTEMCTKTKSFIWSTQGLDMGLRSLDAQRADTMRLIRIRLDCCVSCVRECVELLRQLAATHHGSAQHVLVPPRRRRRRKTEVVQHDECILCWNEFPEGSFVRRKYACCCDQEKSDARRICSACLSRVVRMGRCPYCCKGIR